MRADLPTRARRSCQIAAIGGAILLAALGTSAFAQTILQGWEGIAGPTGSVPPDPHGAAGPNGNIATVNLQISYYTKTGVLNWGPITLQSFWSSVSNSGDGNSDPKVIFDAASRRFFVILQENTGSRFWLNVAVSRTADPKTNGTADWIFYRLDATEFAVSNNAGGINYGGDYPGLAIDGRALYVTYRMYAFLPNGNLAGAAINYQNTSILILDKSRLLNGTGNVVSLYRPEFGLQAVTPQDGSNANVAYFMDNLSATTIGLVSVTDPLGARTVGTASVAIPNRGPGPQDTAMPPNAVGAPQSGSPFRVPTINRTMGNATLVSGDVWFCATRGLAATATTSAGPAVAVYYRIRLNSWPTSFIPTLEEEGTVGNAAEWNFCPAIGVNKKGDVAITWTRSSSSIFPSIVVAFRAAGAGSFGAPQNITPSVTLPGPPPMVIGNTFNVDGRWGDYFSTWPDPNDGTFWITNQWTRPDTGTWSTWWTQVSVPLQDSYVNLNANPATQNGSAATPWVTVTAAHTAITTGTIHIAPGRYNEQLTLNKGVTLVINGSGAVTIGAP